MEAIHKLKINCPYEILKIEDIKISCKPNSHGYLYLKCLIDDSINFKYSIEASTEDKITLYEELEDEEESIIFTGIIESVRTTNENGIYYLELEGASSSSILDMKQKTRSFQDAQMSYDDLINEILKDYKELGFTQRMSRPMSIGKPLFQFKETDYEFLKRVASLLGLELICDIINYGNTFYFGRPDGKSHELDDEINYRACKDLERYYKAKTRGFEIDFDHTDLFYYEIESRQKMDLGDKIYFKQKDLYVNQYEAELHKGELIYKYRFCREDGIWQEKIYNHKIKGISLEGKVLETAGEKVKLHLNIDESQDPSKAAWFYYAPPTGNILYSMPIVGESARLYFQDEIDADPIVTGCVRKNGSTCEAMSDTANRYFATESGNYLDMLPGAISIHRSGLNVNLNDGNGITFSSPGNISISGGSVNLSAGSVSINATSQIKVQKSAGSYISLENEFYAQSSVVYESGSDRESYSAFTDDEPTNGVAEAKKRLEEQLKQAEFKEKQLMEAMSGSEAKAKECSIVPASKDSIPLEGEDLKNRDDIPKYDPKTLYKQGTIVKYESADGEYILGTAGVPEHGTSKIIFTPYDKESYTEHNSPIDGGESLLLGVGNSIQKIGAGTVDIFSYAGQGTNYVTGKVSDGYKAIFGVSPLDGMFDYKPEIWEGMRNWTDNLSSKANDYLYGLAPHKKMFDSGDFLGEIISTMDGACGIAAITKNIPKLVETGIKIASEMPKSPEEIGEFLRNFITGENKAEKAIAVSKEGNNASGETKIYSDKESNTRNDMENSTGNDNYKKNESNDDYKKTKDDEINNNKDNNQQNNNDEDKQNNNNNEKNQQDNNDNEGNKQDNSSNNEGQNTDTKTRYVKQGEISYQGTTEAKYTTKIKWGINDIEARPFGNGFFGKRIPQKNIRVDDFELKINPNNESFYLPHPNGGYVQFENLVGDIVQDGKLIIKQKSFYHVEDLPKFAQNKVIQEAMRQIDSAKAAGYKVEWLVSEEKAADQLTRLFERENIDITVRYYPE